MRVVDKQRIKLATLYTAEPFRVNRNGPLCLRTGGSPNVNYVQLDTGQTGWLDYGTLVYHEPNAKVVVD